MTDTTAGGFIPISSPTPSSTSTNTATPSSALPKQRSHPLRPGSIKESTLINHVDKTLLSINRRHAKKFSSQYEDESEAEQERGYESFKEVVKDVEPVVDLVWISGTPSLQIPYLISLAVLLNSFLPSYAFTPRTTFRILRKLDVMFASLLRGEEVDAEPGNGNESVPLSGFEDRKDIVSMTEKVRIKSIAETGRVVVFESRRGEKSEQGGSESNAASATEEEDDDDDDDHEEEGYENVGRWEMEAARVYERTIQLLGDEFGRVGEFGDFDVSGCR